MSWLKAKDWATGVEYSSLFHSGLRVISLRPRARRARACSSSSSSRENSGGTSSKGSLSSRLLKRSATQKRQPSLPRSTDSSPAPPTRGSRKRPSSMFVRPTKEITDAWSSEGSFIELGEYPKFPEEDSPRAGYLMPPIEIDADRSVAGSRSFFVSLGEMDAAPTGEESFLSLSNSQDTLLHHPIPRRERPVSMQTMPLPSRRSSLRHRRRDRDDGAWVVEETSPDEFVDDEEEVADWRVFHSEWVRNIV